MSTHAVPFEKYHGTGNDFSSSSTRTLRSSATARPSRAPTVTARLVSTGDFDAERNEESTGRRADGVRLSQRRRSGSTPPAS